MRDYKGSIVNDSKPIYNEYSRNRGFSNTEAAKQGQRAFLENP